MQQNCFKRSDSVLDVRVRKIIGALCMNVDFSMDEAGITVFFGKSGAGKTTLVNMIAGLVSPDEGVISCRGRAFFDSHGGVDVPPERRGLGYVFQQHRLFTHMSVRSNLLFASRFCGRPVESGFYERVTELLGIAHLLGRRPATLSGGESQRVAIGRALLACRSFLLMDEPLSSLDPLRKEDLLGYIRSIPKELNIPVIYVTHSIDELSFLADSVLVIDDGRTKQLCSAEEFLKDNYSVIPQKNNNRILRD